MHVLLAVIVAMCVDSAQAWWCAGHMITSQIGAQIAPAAAAYFQKDIDHWAARYPNIATMTEAACWADDIKIQNHSMDTWYYLDWCFLLDGTKCPSPTPKDGILLQILQRCIQVIQDPTSSQDDRSFYIMYVLHLVGDMHQPLHTGAEFSTTFPTGDYGGNLFHVTFGKNNHQVLHAFCDAVGMLYPDDPPRPFSSNPSSRLFIENTASDLINNFTFPSSATDFSGNFTDWAQDSFNLAVNSVYLNGTLKPQQTLTSSYIANVRNVLQSQLALGGRRLASVLNYLHHSSSTHPYNINTPTTGLRGGALAGIIVCGVVVFFAVAYATYRWRTRTAATPTALFEEPLVPCAPATAFIIPDNIICRSDDEKPDKAAADKAAADKAAADQKAEDTREVLHHIVSEIFESEEIYLEGLRCLMDEYLSPIEQRKLSHDTVLSDFTGNAMIIQGCTQNIHSALVKAVGMCSKEKGGEFYLADVDVGAVFLPLLPQLRMYSEYINNYDTVEKRMTTLRAENKTFDDFVAVVEHRISTRGDRDMRFCALCITPIQRMTRYRLFFGELVKHLPNDGSHPFRASTVTCKTGVDKICNYLNENKRMSDNVAQSGTFVSI